MAKPAEQLISVIVPVFNEGDRIVDNLELLISEIEDHFTQFEILVISDGSTDETNAKVFQFKYPGLRLIPFVRNQGKGAAIRKGFEEAKGDFIFFIDGGMELHPKELRIFFGLMSLYEADIVLGSKRHPQSKIYYPAFRRFLSRVYQKIIKTLFKVDVTDTQVGMKLFRREVVQSVLPFLKVDRYGFDLEILSLASLFGFKKMLEAPVQMDYFSKNPRPFVLELVHVFKVGLSLLKDTLKLYLRIREIRSHLSPDPKLAKVLQK
jgi:glycosyltransferase involved in cell wall biosynthesis